MEERKMIKKFIPRLSEDDGNGSSETVQEQTINSEVQVPETEGIVLPEIAAPTKEEHIPTLEELEAQKKAEENSIIAQKKENHEKTFNRDEEILYTIKEEKEGNPLVIIAVFGFIVLFMVSLPTISKTFKKVFGIDFNFFEVQKPNQGNVTSQNNETEKKHKFNDSSTRVSIGDLSMTNFVTAKTGENTYELNFTIINEGDESYIYDKKYYILLYNNESLLYRALIHSYTPLASKAASELSLTISQNAFTNANAFELVEISETQYPDVITVAVSDEYDVLTCTYNEDTMEYYFEDNMLVKVKEKYFVETDKPQYEKNLSYYRNRSDYYNTLKGFNSTFVETSSDFTMITEASLNDIQDIVMNDLKEYRYFKFRTKINVVAFEMTAQGYVCDNN